MSMLQVKILYVRNLAVATTEDALLRLFSKSTKKVDPIERVKKIKDYAFIHFKDRADAIVAMQALNGKPTDVRMEALKGTTVLTRDRFAESSKPAK